MLGALGALATIYLVCKSYDRVYLDRISAARQDEWKSNESKINWNDAGTVKRLFMDDNIEVVGTPGGNEYRICGVGLDSQGCLTMRFSSFRKDRMYDVRDVNHAIAGYLRTEEGQMDFCNSFLQRKIERAYSSLALDGQSLQLTERMEHEIGHRFRKIDILETRFLLPDNAGLAVKFWAGKYRIYLKDLYWGKEHELLHVVSGLLYDKHSGNSFVSEIDKDARFLTGIVNLGLNQFGISVLVGTPTPTKFEQIMKADGDWAFEEAMTSFVNKDADYPSYTVPLKKSLMKLAPSERKMMFDALILSWLNLSSRKDNDKSLAFFTNAFGE